MPTFRGKKKMPSKAHSCSELEAGSRQLFQVKQEAEREDELQKQIKEFWLAFCSIICFF